MIVDDTGKASAQELKKESFPILVVEDHPVSRKLLEKTLTKAGHPVKLAENGRKALELFKEEFFPIVLSDWMMPEMDGLELCKAIRSQSRQGYVFIVLLTSRDSKEDTIAGLQAGADDYLAKPFNLGELMARLNTAMRILNLERSLRKANEEIRELSITDPLTGCFNRGYVSQRLPIDIASARRYKHPLSLIMCDIDRFKNINDTRGHRFGDQVLIIFVRCLMVSIRKYVDWVARYGGEEFLIVLPETNEYGAKVVAERLRKKIALHPFAIGDIEINITASFGSVTFHPGTFQGEVTPVLLVDCADKFLYTAKNNGRNQTRGGIFFSDDGAAQTQDGSARTPDKR